MKRVLLRVKAKRWCEVEINLDKGVLSVSGSYGEILTCREAKREAFRYWVDFFQENKEALGRMAVEHGTRNAKSAARKVLAVDGEFHGLDVCREQDGKVYTCHGCGQCWEEMLEFFPEIAKLQRWHLNDMRPGCLHQEAMGWGKGHDVTFCGEKTYKDSLGAPCPYCGYKYGSAWLKRELPPEIISLVENVGKDAHGALVLVKESGETD